MNTTTILVGIAFAVIGFLVAIFAVSFLSIYLSGWAMIIAVFGLVLWSVAEGALFKQQTRKCKQVIIPILSTVIVNLLIVNLFIDMDKQLFEGFVSDFGLSGSWSLFILNMQANIDGTIKTYPYINGTFVIVLFCVAGNIILSAVYLARSYRDKEKLFQETQIPPPPPQPRQFKTHLSI